MVPPDSSRFPLHHRLHTRIAGMPQTWKHPQGVRAVGGILFHARGAVPEVVMPSAVEIVQGLGVIARQWAPLALLWHVYFAVLWVAILGFALDRASRVA